MSCAARTSIRTMLIIVIAAFGLACPYANADDAYFKVALRDLTLSEGRLPADPMTNWEGGRRQWAMMQWMRPYAAMDGGGEAYVQPPGRDQQRWDRDFLWTRDAELLVRQPAHGDATGALFVPKEDFSAMDKLRFTIPASKANTEHRADFLHAKENHYLELQQRELPGGAWFRHLVREARSERTGTTSAPATQPQPAWRPGRRGDLVDTYALLTGGRALSENLQLDRTLPESTPQEDTVDVDTIQGISVAEIDWAPLIAGVQPRMDRLASSIPFDQHAIFFPSFEAMIRLADEAAAHGTPILRLLEPRAEDARVRERYERQLCLPLNTLAGTLGPNVVKSLAITGSDPYLRTGTDVAIIFEPTDAEQLMAFIDAQHAASSRFDATTRPTSGRIEEIAWYGLRSADRTICSYFSLVGDTVIVTNSLAQLERLIQTKIKPEANPSLATLDEYKFFRDRYKAGEEETAFIFLSDATIRRWCGPKWRVATSRRTRDAAVLAELQASHLGKLAGNQFEPGPIHTDLPTAQVGDLVLTSRGVYSSTLNTLAFMTPIAELDISRVSNEEAEAYNRWRDMYQRNWRQFFDPIGVRIVADGARLAADVTVMPLILRTDYATYRDITRGVTLKPHAGDPHDAIVHFAMAVNVESQQMQWVNGMAAMVAPKAGNALAWLGQSVALYFDNDQFWADLTQTPEDDRDEFMEQNIHRVPVTLHAEVKDQMRLVGFLTAVRAMIEQTAPDMTIWENLKHGEQSYVRIRASDAAQQQMDMPPLAIVYAPSAEGLTISLSEDVLKRALDRRAARKAGGEAAAKLDAGQGPWLGSSMALKARGEFLNFLSTIARETWRDAMRTRSWGNIPILNEWKRHFPEQDPVALHEKFWHTRLRCPGGGEYAWNDDYDTFESTVFGSPASPKEGPAAPPLLSEFSLGDFGVTFEEHGVRARTQLLRHE